MDKEQTLKNCSITFEKPNGIYYAGETISGSVNLTHDKAKKYKEILLRVEGYSEVKWSESRLKPGNFKHANSNNSNSVTFSAKEVYFRTFNHLIQPNSDESAMEFSSGTHKFTFSFTLPTNVPSSFEGTRGRIRYEVMVRVKQPQKEDSIQKALFTVMSSLDLNDLPGTALPHSISEFNNLYFLFMKKGLCQITVEAPRTGFICGEQISLKCLISNQSEVKIEQLRLSLYQIVTYIAQVPQHKAHMDHIKILSEYGENVEGRTDVEREFIIIVPSLPTSSLNYCSTIIIKYCIRVKARMSGIHEDITCEFPITIGTIPLTNESIEQANPITSVYSIDSTNQVQTSQSNSMVVTTHTMSYGDPPPYEQINETVSSKEGIEYNKQ